MFQQLVVFAIVVAAAVIAAWRLPGAATRLRYARGLQKIGLKRLGERLAARELRAITAGGCAACSSRDSHGPPKR